MGLMFLSRSPSLLRAAVPRRGTGDVICSPLAWPRARTGVTNHAAAVRLRPSIDGLSSTASLFPGPPSQSAPPGWYRHYKSGHLYFVLGTVLHTETSEVMVLYRAVDTDEAARGRNPYNMAFARPSAMFLGTVDHHGQQVPRFERLLERSSRSPASAATDRTLTSTHSTIQPTPHESIHWVRETTITAHTSHNSPSLSPIPPHPDTRTAASPFSLLVRVQRALLDFPRSLLAVSGLIRNVAHVGSGGCDQPLQQTDECLPSDAGSVGFSAQAYGSSESSQTHSCSGLATVLHITHLSRWSACVCPLLA